MFMFGKRKENSVGIHSQIVNAFWCVRVRVCFNLKRNENKTTNTFSIIFSYQVLYFLSIFREDNIHIRVSVLISPNSENHDVFVHRNHFSHFPLSNTYFFIHFIVFAISALHLMSAIATFFHLPYAAMCVCVWAMCVHMSHCICVQNCGNSHLINAQRFPTTS